VEDEVKLLESHEGARIGCKLSSFAFALTVQDLYQDISAMLSRRRDGSCIKAATDDVLIILKADRSNERALYALIEKERVGPDKSCGLASIWNFAPIGHVY
jgi:hypothetical protein